MFIVNYLNNKENMLCCVCVAVVEYQDAQGGSVRCLIGWNDINPGYRDGFLFFICLVIVGGFVIVDRGQKHNTSTLTAEFSGRKRDEEMSSSHRLSDSEVRVKHKERLLVLCIDCGCFHVLTHPRDH